MPNVNSPFGLRRASQIARLNTSVNEYAHDSGDATALFTGDAVVTTGTSTTGKAGIQDGTPLVIASGTITTTAIRGFIEGISPTLSNLSLNYGLASTDYTLLVCDDPNVVVNIQTNGTNVVGDISGNIGITAAAGNTSSGTSNYVATQAALGSTNVLRILRLAPIVGNSLGANAVLECTINAHELKSTSGT